MTTNPHHRAVQRYLRDQYGLPSKLQYGGKHPFLIVVKNGDQHRFVLSATPSDRNSTLSALHEIKQRFGSPPIKPINDKRQLEQMMPNIPDTPFNPLILMTRAAESFAESMPAPVAPDPPPPEPIPPETNARVAVYHETEHTQRINIYVPRAMAEQLANGPVGVERLDNETFQLSKAWNVKRRFHYQTQDKKLAHVTVVLPSQHLPFGASPAQATVIDGTIVVVCPTATRLSLGPPPVQRPTPTLTRISLGSPPAPRPTPEVYRAATPTPPLANNREYLLSLLSAITEVEKHGDWRLVKVNGAWRFRIPDIGLEEDQG